jgi:exosortase/archaeosortase family protein
MTMSARRLVARFILVMAAAGTVFLLAINPSRSLETEASARVLQSVVHDRVQVQLGTSLQVFPPSAAPFRARLTPACSALSSVVTIVALGLLLPAPSRRRRLMSCLVAAAVVAACNVLRIAASIGIGLLLGRMSLVLFHDWIGSAFTFAYTLAGLMALLYLRMPATAVGAEREAT